MLSLPPNSHPSPYRACLAKREKATPTEAPASATSKTSLDERASPFSTLSERILGGQFILVQLCAPPSLLPSHPGLRYITMQSLSYWPLPHTCCIFKIPFASARGLGYMADIASIHHQPLESTVHCPALPSAPSYVPAGQLYPAIRTRSQASKQSSEKKQGQGKERLPVQPAEYRNRNRYLIDNDRRLRPTPPSTNASSSPENNFFFF
jgi:hypothetical protein